MELTELLETGKRYHWKRTDGWNWDGVERWWVIDVEIHGYYGDLGFDVTEYWRWNGQIEDHFVKPRKLTYAESCDLTKLLEDRIRDSAGDSS